MNGASDAIALKPAQMIANNSPEGLTTMHEENVLRPSTYRAELQ